MVRASLGGAIFCRWPLPATSQESETRGLRDTFAHAVIRRLAVECG